MRKDNATILKIKLLIWRTDSIFNLYMLSYIVIFYKYRNIR